VAPHPDGLGMIRAIERALRMADLDPSEVDYINAHGTATDTNDPVELRAIKSVFGLNSRTAISSTKAVSGHLLAAAGTVEAIVCALSLCRGVMPPTANLEAVIPEGEGLDIIQRLARPYPVRNALNLSVGFGGKNSALAFARYTQ
jgi:3-oxoacyl-(acyl-carrier-protein) synthase